MMTIVIEVVLVVSFKCLQGVIMEEIVVVSVGGGPRSERATSSNKEPHNGACSHTMKDP
jgi:hypothetical protein